MDQLTTATTGAQPGAGNLAKLRALVEVARVLQSSLTTEEVLAAVVDAAVAVTGSERGFLLLKQREDLDIRVARDRRGHALPSGDLRVPTRLIRRALEQRRELLSMNFDPSTEDAARPDVSVADLELRSVVCVPLVRVRTEVSQQTMAASLNETVGLLYLDSRLDAADLSSGNRELLQTLALEASTILENARLREQERARQRLEEELRIARTIQQDLLPRRLPHTGWFRAAGSSLASHQVGGDYFDVTEIRPDCWAAVVTDVSGKGVSSALLASLMQGAFLRTAETGQQIEEMLARLNRFLLERTQGEKYATLFYCTLSSDGTLHWTNAAHCAPFLVRAGGELESLAPTGMPVGMLEIATYEVQTTRLEPGDKIVAYSDGFTDAQNAEGEFFELSRLRGLVRAHATADCRALHDALLASLKAFTGDAGQKDDITLLVMEYLPE